MEEIEMKKASALRTMLEMMDVPEMRHDTTRPANIRWLHRNLRINNSDHPLFETAIGLVVWLMKSGSRAAERNRPVC
tara:strand:- start:441 stop:671 length:231 start_codon:yes stop_codon:yes gene_type:complete